MEAIIKVVSFILKTVTQPCYAHYFSAVTILSCELTFEIKQMFVDSLELLFRRVSFRLGVVDTLTYYLSDFYLDLVVRSFVGVHSSQLELLVQFKMVFPLLQAFKLNFMPCTLKFFTSG